MPSDVEYTIHLACKVKGPDRDWNDVARATAGKLCGRRLIVGSDTRFTVISATVDAAEDDA